MELSENEESNKNSLLSSEESKSEEPFYSARTSLDNEKDDFIEGLYCF